jgi:dihydrofolate reductase
MNDALSYIDAQAGIGSIWIIGGSSVYAEAVQNPRCKRIFLTSVEKEDQLETIECDTFFPTVDESVYPRNCQEMERIAAKHQIPLGLSHENGYQFEFQLYERGS